MRSREEIHEDEIHPKVSSPLARLTLEVLLDIRDLLTPTLVDEYKKSRRRKSMIEELDLGESIGLLQPAGYHLALVEAKLNELIEAVNKLESDQEEIYKDGLRDGAARA